MFNHKKSQGLSFSTIVLAVISIFILVLVIIFVSKGFVGINRPVEQFTPTEVSAAQQACTVFCREAQATVRTEQDFKNSRYCTKTFLIDRSGSGVGLVNPDGDVNDVANGNINDDRVQCTDIDTGTSLLWTDYLVPCTVQLVDGKTVSHINAPGAGGCPDI